MKLSCLSVDTCDPYGNLAMEEHLLSLAREEEIILYLWQNRRTVVIGQNQNALREVNLARLGRDGGRLARRLSGGGAVYHDLGNLNFTFIVPKRLYDVPRQTRVILEAVRALGVPAGASGRNDLVADGRKFSGNAFYRRGAVWYHHGTLLLHADLGALEEYLNVSPEKLRAKGVASVRSRVCNLREFVPGLTVPDARLALAKAFGREYGGKAAPFDQGRIDERAVASIRERISSDDYLLGSRPFSGCCLERRFPWGEVQLTLCVEGGRITACRAYSDAMEEDEIARLPALLTGCAVDGEAFRRALTGWGTKAMRADAVSLLMEL